MCRLRARHGVNITRTPWSVVPSLAIPDTTYPKKEPMSPPRIRHYRLPHSPKHPRTPFDRSISLGHLHAGVLEICSDQTVFWGVLGNEGVCSVGFWEGTLVLFLGRWYREWQEKAPRTMEFELCSLHVSPSNGTYLCIYVLYYVIYYISSLCSGGFADATACMC